MEKIKRKVVTNFTTVQNDFLRDRSLGFTERGLLVTMLSLPDNWDFSAVGLASIVPDGKAKTYASLSKLEKAGYLKRSRIYEDGKVVDWLYEFCDMPVFLEENLVTENQEVGENLVTDFLELGKLEQGNLEQGNRENNKRTKKSNTKELNILLNQSINLSEAEEPKATPAQPKQKKIDRVIDTETINDIKDQLEYDILIHDIEKDFLDMVVSCLAELYTASEPLTFTGRTFSPEFIHKRSLEIDTEHVKYVYDCFKEQRDKVYNIRKYLLTAIFNAPDTMGAYYTNLVRAQGAVY